ncbi:receptor-like protein 32 [Carex rostrata]
MPSLKYLDLCGNKLSGPMPDSFWNLTNLIEVDLSVNSFTGSLTDARLNNLPKLEVLSLGGNQLCGEVPPPPYSISFYDLSNNTLAQFPDSFEAPQLTELYLSNNLISGNIHSKLAMLKKLRVLDLADNNLSGPLPENLGTFSGMSSLKHDADEPSDPLFQRTEELFESDYLHLPTGIDLSNNYLTGEIPRNITALIGLVNLNLSHNHLIGEIPAEIERMRSLQSLDLHLNNLSGSIPPSISGLNSVKVIDLSYNNLSGSIPTKYYLHKLNASSIYTGNPYLCGPPLENSCVDGETSSDNNNNSRHVSHVEKWLYFFIEFGFVVGCFVVVSVLLFILVLHKQVHRILQIGVAGRYDNYLWSSFFSIISSPVAFAESCKYE